MPALRSGFRLASFLFTLLVFVVNVTVLYDYREAIACRFNPSQYCPVINGEVDPKFSSVRTMYETLWANGTEKIGSQLIVYHGTKKVIDLWAKPYPGVYPGILFRGFLLVPMNWISWQVRLTRINQYKQYGHVPRLLNPLWLQCLSIEACSITMRPSQRIGSNLLRKAKITVT